MRLNFLNLVCSWQKFDTFKIEKVQATFKYTRVKKDFFYSFSPASFCNIKKISSITMGEVKICDFFL